jgi:hypothetical protein
VHSRSPATSGLAGWARSIVLVIPVIDFGDRATLIARQVAWAPDGASIYAAVADVNADIVLLDGLI